MLQNIILITEEIFFANDNIFSIFYFWIFVFVFLSDIYFIRYSESYDNSGNVLNCFIIEYLSFSYCFHLI